LKNLLEPGGLIAIEIADDDVKINFQCGTLRIFFELSLLGLRDGYLL